MKKGKRDKQLWESNKTWQFSIYSPSKGTGSSSSFNIDYNELTRECLHFLVLVTEATSLSVRKITSNCPSSLLVLPTVLLLPEYTLTPQTTPKWSKYSHYVTRQKPLLSGKKVMALGRFTLSSGVHSRMVWSLEFLICFCRSLQPLHIPLPHHTCTEAVIKGFK